MTVQDITRLIVLPAAYTESKKGAVLKPHPFYKLSGRMIDYVYATAVFIDSADNQLPFQSVLLGKEYREKEIRERRPGAALRWRPLSGRQCGSPSRYLGQRRDTFRQSAGRFPFGCYTDNARLPVQERRPPSDSKSLCISLKFRCFSERHLIFLPYLMLSSLFPPWLAGSLHNLYIKREEKRKSRYATKRGILTRTPKIWIKRTGRASALPAVYFL